MSHPSSACLTMFSIFRNETHYYALVIAQDRPASRVDISKESPPLPKKKESHAHLEILDIFIT
ncbi:MAG: hypothetical protein ACOZCF_08775 [Bacillota bacterium]